jgi:hypothetical protein
MEQPREIYDSALPRVSPAEAKPGFPRAGTRRAAGIDHPSGLPPSTDDAPGGDAAQQQSFAAATKLFSQSPSQAGNPPAEII